MKNLIRKTVFGVLCALAAAVLMTGCGQDTASSGASSSSGADAAASQVSTEMISPDALGAGYTQFKNLYSLDSLYLDPFQKEVIYEFTYDANGRLESYFHNVMPYSSRTTLQYDESGLLVSSETRSENNDPATDYEYFNVYSDNVYTVDQENGMISWDSYGFEDDLLASYKAFFDEQGRLASLETYDETGALRYTYTYEYADDGTITEQSQSASSPDIYSTCIYDPQGCLVMRESHNNGWVDRVEYDTEALTIKESESSSSELKSESLTICEERNGRILRVEYVSHYNYMSSYIHVYYSYDDQGREIKAEFYDEQDRMSDVETYEYNEDGSYTLRRDSYDENQNLTEYYIKEYDADGKEVSKQTYDGSGNLKS